jgi:protein-arginine kinase activator protein McsA
MAFPAPSGSHQASVQRAPAPHCHLPGQAPLTPAEGEHQIEKLEFALAVALTRGDLQRSAQLRDQIAALGGNREEPGT